MRRGFSLVELMIAVAIVGILAAIAIPRFDRMAMAAKRAEMLPNAEGIRIAQVSQEAVNGVYLSCSMSPRTWAEVDRKAVPWEDKSGGCWKELGWQPDGDVRAAYETTELSANEFMAFAATDIDEDGFTAEVEASTSKTAHYRTPEGEY